MSTASKQMTKSGDWTTLFYRNPRLLSLTLCVILVAGLAAIMVLPRMEDPVLTQRAAIINTVFPGASAERVEALVTDKIEAKLQDIEEIKDLRSTSSDGISTITIELQDSVLRSEAPQVWSRLRDKLADASVNLPDAALDPEFDRLNISAYALIVALRWDAAGEPNYRILRRYAEELDDRLRQISGTKEVDIFGDPEEEILVSLDPNELTQRSLSVSDVARQLDQSDAKVSAGSQRSASSDVLLEIGSELDSLGRIRATPIQFSVDSQAVNLGDIAQVGKAVRTPVSTLSLVNGKPAVCVAALVKSNKRVDVWFDDAREVLADFQADLPQGVTQDVRFEQDTYVRGRLQTLFKNLLLGALAVVAVVGVMMGWRSAVVVGAALPLASLMVLSGLNLLGIPLHQMSITGLIIALGLLIDNAIVIVDEVGHHIEDGASPLDAIGKSVRHLAVPLFGSTFTTALSFAPICLMPGPAGEFVGAIAVSVLLAIFSSFFLAMTITPTLAAMFQPRIASPVVVKSHETTAYENLLRFLFRWPLVGVAVSVVVPLVGLGFGSTLTEQFFPPADRDQLRIQFELPAMASLARTNQMAEEARQLLVQDETVESVDWYIGESAPSFYYNMLASRSRISQYGEALVQLTRSNNLPPLIHRLQAKLDSEFPAGRFIVRQLEQGPPFEAPIEIRVFGSGIDELRELGNEVRRVLAANSNVVHVTTTMGQALPTYALNVDEEKARLAGVTQLEIAQQLDAALEGAVGGLVLEDTEELPVRVRVGDDVRGDLDRIASLQIMATGTDGVRRPVPLSSLATVTLEPKVPSIQRFDTQRMNEVRGYLRAGTLPADVLTDFKERFADAGVQFPSGYRLEYGGEASKRDEAVGNLMSSVGVLLVIMVATLVLSFSSYRIAIIIGAVAFLSVGLSLGALAVFGYPFGFMAIVGTMGLIGVAINDTIVVLAAIRDDDAARAAESEAMARVVRRSTRHVLATTFTTIAGFTPLLLGGGGFWPPLATGIAGGVSGATLLALIFGPCCYVLLMKPTCPFPGREKPSRNRDKSKPSNKPTTDYDDVAGCAADQADAP